MHHERRHRKRLLLKKSTLTVDTSPPLPSLRAVVHTASFYTRSRSHLRFGTPSRVDPRTHRPTSACTPHFNTKAARDIKLLYFPSPLGHTNGRLRSAKNVCPKIQPLGVCRCRDCIKKRGALLSSTRSWPLFTLAHLLVNRPSLR